MGGYFAHCAYTRAFSLHVSREVFLRVHARLFSFLFSIIRFRGRRAPLLQRRVPFSPEPPHPSSTVGLPLYFVYVLFSFLFSAGCCCVCTQACFFAGSPRGGSALHAAFSFLFSVIYFQGRKKHLNASNSFRKIVFFTGDRRCSIRKF